jgi:hypothetical protein
VFDPGERVQLLTKVGYYELGTIATVVELKPDFTCLVEFASGIRLSVDPSALGKADVRSAPLFKETK